MKHPFESIPTLQNPKKDTHMQRRLSAPKSTQVLVCVAPTPS